jgi:GT2 family glycosyltransferase
MSTSVVIPAYNGWEYLKKNLPLVMSLGADEVIVVDDASTDGTPEHIKKNFPKIKLIVHETNQRFPAAVNNGFSKAGGEIVILLNQDLTPDRDLLKAALPFFKNSEIFAVTFNEGKLAYATAEFVDGFLEYGNGPQSDAPHQSFWASGGSAAFRRSDWENLGGFDTVFHPGYYEDLDLGWRARRRGLEILWLPKAKVDHVRETAYKKAFPETYLNRIKERNYLICHWKNLSTSYLLQHLMAVFLRCLKSPGFLYPLFLAVLKLPEVMVFRSKERRLIKRTDKQIFTTL